MAIVEAVSQVLLDLLLDWVDHRDFILTQISIHGNELNLTEFEDNGRVLTGASGERLHNSAHLLTLRDHDEVQALLDVEDANEAEDLSF